MLNSKPIEVPEHARGAEDEAGDRPLTERALWRRHAAIGFDFVNDQHSINFWSNHNSNARCASLVFFIISTTFGIHPANSQPVTTPQPTVYSEPSYCKQSTLTSMQFMELVHAVITHGDLTDIPFIEKTLGSKLSLKYGDIRSTTLHPESSTYGTDHILGDPIQADLYVSYSKARQLKYNLIARMSVGSQTSPGYAPDFLENCLHISSSDFSSYFGGKFLYLNPIPDQLVAQSLRPPVNFNLPDTNALQQLGNPGKDGSKIYLRYSFNTDTNFVIDVGIFQEP